MHIDATWEDEPVFQLMAKKVVEDKVVSVTMSDFIFKIFRDFFRDTPYVTTISWARVETIF